MSDLRKIGALLQDAVNRRIGSGIAASFGKLSDLSKFNSSHELFLGTTSHPSPKHSITENTFFDLASLTKILATTTLAMKLYDQGKLDLELTLAQATPEIVSLNSSLAPIRIRELLTHSSGLPSWKPFYEEMRAYFGVQLPLAKTEERKLKFDQLLHAVPREFDPGQKIVYSDLGFVTLEKVISNHFQKDTESLWRSMGIHGLHFRPVTTDAATAHFQAEQNKEAIAATEICPWRGQLVGQVHDNNAWSRGGVAGHAGAFGRLKDVREWIRAVFLGSEISKATLEVFTKESARIGGTRRALGFDMPSGDGSGSTGFSFSKNTVGHLGFTGTSLWVDLNSGDYAILLTNRVHPDRNDLRIRQLRREFHHLVRGT
jgi:CubicO group peptidase (beta-lactamase class C family)